MTTIHADNLDTYIAENGYARGNAERGKVILIGADIRILAWDGWFSYEISEPIATLDEAESMVRARKPASRAFADAATLEQYLVENDGPRGYGR